MKKFALLGLVFLFSIPIISQDTLQVKIQDTLKPTLFEYPFGDPEKDLPRGVYGSDDRKDVTDAEGIADFVRATATMIHKRNMKLNEDGNYLFYGKTLRDKLTREYNSNNFHKNVKFLDQPTIAQCTGFLIGPDILVTAGHCIDNIYKAQNYVWVFDYTNELDFVQSQYYNDKKYIVVDPDNVYETKEIIAALDDDMIDDKDDFSILRFDRKSNRNPYRFRTSGKIGLYSKIYTIGSPTGLPIKFADNATVKYNSMDKYFQTDIDVFPGNSGGPAFAQYGFLEGIIVRTGFKSLQDGTSSGDYWFDKNCNCIRTVQFSSTKYAYPTDVSRIEKIPYWILELALYDNLEYAIENGLNDRLDTWLVYSWIVDRQYTIERGRLEEVAAKFNNLYALKSIMKVSDNTKQDLYGYKALAYSIMNGNKEMVNYLLEQDIDYESLELGKQSHLFYAIEYDQLEILKKLIDTGWEINSVDRYGDNLLHWAARKNKFDLIKELVDLGVSTTTKNNGGKWPEYYAKKAKNKKAKKYLKKIRKKK